MSLFKKEKSESKPKDSELIEMLLERIVALEGKFNSHSHVSGSQMRAGEPSSYPNIIYKEHKE